jgi:hypothetical protein
MNQIPQPNCAATREADVNSSSEPTVQPRRLSYAEVLRAKDPYSERWSAEVVPADGGLLVEACRRAFKRA